MNTESELSLDNISAQIYLDKLREFSDTSLLTNEISIEQFLNKTMEFIVQILPIDYAFIAEIIHDGRKAIFKSVYGIKNPVFYLNATQAQIITALTGQIFQFDASNEVAREQAGYLLHGVTVTSGVSLPIDGKSGPRGVLAVYSKSNAQFSSSKIHFLRSMVNVMAFVLESSDMLPQIEIRNAGHVIRAKREWESAVDSLDRLVVVINEKAEITRTNKTIQDWELGTVDSDIGEPAIDLLKKLLGENAVSIVSGWENYWSELKALGQLEWEDFNPHSKKIYRFSLRALSENGDQVVRKSHQAYAALIVDDITKIKLVEFEAKKYTSRLEEQVRFRTSQLQRLNNQLKLELEEHRRNKAALLQSEKRYARLIQNSLTGICTLTSGRIDFYNSRFAQILGSKHVELNNTLFIQLICSEDRVKIINAFAALDSGKGPSDLIVVRVNRNGAIIWLEVMLDYLQKSKGNTILVNVYDISLQKSIEISLRESESRLHALSCQLLCAQEMERKRLAMDLHDGIGQSLSAIKYSIENIIRDNSRMDDGEWLKIMHGVVDSIRITIDDARCMAMNLRPSILDDLGVVAAIHWFCSQYQSTYTHINVETNISVEESKMDDNRKIVIYRVIQESLNNVAKHSGATNVRIDLSQDDNLGMYLRIADNGCGFEKKTNDGRYQYTGMGLNSIEERVNLLGGVFNLFSNYPSGTIIDIRWSAQAITLC